jgi:[acyl-carrier-protein] S-malonyltransferase
MCLNQPEKLSTTRFSQPAILVTTLAMVEKEKSLEVSSGVGINEATHAAGFSLGEYTALIFSGALSFEDGVRLIKNRAEGMQTAAEVTEGSMITVVGLDDDKLNILCTDSIIACGSASADQTIGIANYLFPQGRVLSGAKVLVKWVAQNATKPKYGAMVATELAVAGAFHSQYMSSARASLAQALTDVEITMPRIQVYSNVTALPYTTVEEIREGLVRQLESPVLWEQTIKHMIDDDNVTAFIDAGPGAQLKSMMRRIEKKAFAKTSVLDK